MDIRCESRIERVVVHARGAVVSRTVSLPDGLPDGDVDLLVPSLTLFAQAGSLRASLRATARSIVFAQLGFHVPATTAVAGPSAERVRALDRRIERLRAEEGALQRRRSMVEEIHPQPSPRTMLLGADVAQRVEDGVACASVVRAEIAALDERLLELARAIERLSLERSAAQLEDAQTSAAARSGTGQPTREARIRLSGTGPAQALQIAYAVPAARWWPRSTLRLTEAATKASWTLEALVAQASGEDWRGCRLALSTADLTYDARLPELPSLRFGRAQPARPTGYRPPPAGLEQLFSAFDRAFPSGLPGASAPRRDDLAQSLMATGLKQAPPLPPPMPAPVSAPSLRDEDIVIGAGVGPFADDEEEPAELPPAPAMREVRAKRAAAPRPQAPAPMMMAARAPMLGGGGPPGAPPPAPPPPPEPAEVEPASGWLDFDALAIAGPEERRRRGKLSRDSGADALAPARTAAEGRIEGASPHPLLRDPMHTRGLFDHRYDAEGAVDVPSDGIPHRVAIATAAATPSLRFRTVPRESADVYREAELRNPFDAPLLDGPVDVYVEGTLLTTTAAPRIDKGGVLAVGLGVEDRIRVARNARVEETNAGVFGGSTAVTHAITIDVTSSLGREVPLEVIDRVPVTDDKEIEIARIAETPRSEEYKQVDRGRPVRGGRLFRVTLPPGGSARVESTWRVTFAAKDELVGGNRRE